MAVTIVRSPKLLALLVVLIPLLSLYILLLFIVECLGTREVLFLLLLVVVSLLFRLVAVLFMCMLVLIIATLVLVVAAHMMVVVASLMIEWLLCAPVTSSVVILSIALLVVTVSATTFLLVKGNFAKLLLSLRNNPVKLERAQRWLEASEKKVLQVRIVWLFVELQFATVCKIRLELFWVALTECLYRSAHFFLLDFFVFLVLLAHLQALPWKTASQKVHQYKADRLKIIPPRLF